MDQTPSGLPPRRGLTPTAQPFYPQLFAPPMVPFYDQQYQQSVLMPAMNHDGTGANFPVWHPGSHPAPNFYPCYQQGFGTPLHTSFHQQNQNFTHPGEHLNEYPHDVRDRYLNLRKLELQQNFGQSPPLRYLGVPQNTPELPYFELDRHNQPQPNLPGSNDNLSAKPTQMKRHRGSSFPGTSPPAFKHFEGSKKQDWNTYSSRSDSQRSNRQRPGSSDSNTPPLQRTESSSIDHSLSYNSLSAANRKQPNFQGAYQEGPRLHEGFHQQARGDRKPIPAAFRKPHFARPSLISPASAIHWVEIKSRNKIDSVQIGQRGSSDKRPASDNSVDPIPPLTFAVYAEKTYSPPVIVTSCPVTVKNCPEISSQNETNEPRQTNFTLNPKASNFVMVSRSAFPEASNEEDEYVGYYMSENENKFLDLTENVPVISHDGHPMNWQLPDDSTIRRIPKEFVGRTPGKMNWDNGTFNVIRDDQSVRSWGSWNSEDEAEVQARIAVTGSPPAPQEGKEKLVSKELSFSVKTGLSNEQPKLVNNNSQTENAHTGNGIQSSEGNHKDLSKSSDSHAANGQPLGGVKDTETNKPSFETLKCIDVTKGKNVCMSTGTEKIEKVVGNTTIGHNLKTVSEGGKPEENATQSQDLEGKKSKSKGKKKKKKTDSITLLKTTPESNVEEKLHKNDKPEPALPLANILPAQTQAMAIDSSAPSKNDERSKVSAPLPVKENLEIPKTPISKDVARPVFNYRDALLKKVESPQISVASIPNLQIQKIEKINPPNPQTPKVEKTAHSKPITPKPQVQKAERDVKSGPSTEIGLRRKFFLQPIPNTVTYHSLIQQLRGGMLEDIYVSGLSPHPSAWKGSRGEVEDRGGDGTRYGHVSFYSNEGANNFWELVNTGNQQSDSYTSPYGGFDDEAPGFFILDGVKVSVHWRHNDQRLVNPATLKAVKEECATRCILLRFDAGAIMEWNKDRKTVPGKLVKNEIVFTGPGLIKKIKADIEIWGMADSNLENVEVVGAENSPESTEIAENSANKQKPKEIKVVVSFIKILSAVKLKKFLSNKPEYSNGGYCQIEYYKDICAESIDKLKAARMAEENLTKKNTNSRRKKSAARAAKESIVEGNGGGKNTTEGNDFKDNGAVKHTIALTGHQSEGAIAKEDKITAKKKSAEVDHEITDGGNGRLREGLNKPRKTVVIGKLL